VLRILSPSPISFRLADDSDCEKLLEWRNHLSNRRYAFDPSPVDPAVHRRWFRETLANPARILLVGAVNQNDAGVLRYDLSEHEARVSIYLDPAQHGMGYGTALLAAGSEWLRAQHPAVNAIIAEVMPANIASIRAFLAAGYRETHRSFRFELRAADIKG